MSLEMFGQTGPFRALEARMCRYPLVSVDDMDASSRAVGHAVAFKWLQATLGQLISVGHQHLCTEARFYDAIRIAGARSWRENEAPARR